MVLSAADNGSALSILKRLGAAPAAIEDAEEAGPESFTTWWTRVDSASWLTRACVGAGVDTAKILGAVTELVLEVARRLDAEDLAAVLVSSDPIAGRLEALDGYAEERTAKLRAEGVEWTPASRLAMCEWKLAVAARALLEPGADDSARAMRAITFIGGVHVVTDSPVATLAPADVLRRHLTAEDVLAALGVK